ncbi:hypothetical protein EHO58_10415 [Leptospira selangorensis]|uniref:hypothetical protein n=1 Tax=Leptospira selangorensis TaxID=2484982 RepID=UPI00108425CA|nr:hypothetical protein [Leptospira selangorensis]TGK05718.1 hypothetical protein EHO58_10415 [Leptospira selangorensis]
MYSNDEMNCHVCSKLCIFLFSLVHLLFGFFLIYNGVSFVVSAEISKLTYSYIICLVLGCSSGFSVIALGVIVLLKLIRLYEAFLISLLIFFFLFYFGRNSEAIMRIFSLFRFSLFVLMLAAIIFSFSILFAYLMQNRLEFSYREIMRKFLFFCIVAFLPPLMVAAFDFVQRVGVERPVGVREIVIKSGKRNSAAINFFRGEVSVWPFMGKNGEIADLDFKFRCGHNFSKIIIHFLQPKLTDRMSLQERLNAVVTLGNEEFVSQLNELNRIQSVDISINRRSDTFNLRISGGNIDIRRIDVITYQPRWKWLSESDSYDFFLCDGSNQEPSLPLVVASR